MTLRDDLRSRPWLIAWLLLVLPLAWWTVELVAGGWVPHGDTAVAAVRVHDVFGSHTPLLGMPSTSGQTVAGVHAHHPGPLHFQLLAPLYAVTGYAPWALVVGSFVLIAGLLALALAAADVAGGQRGVIAVAVAQAVVLPVAGSQLVTPWNPWVAMVAFTAAVTCGWAVLVGRGGWWPAFIVTLSLAAQSHLAVAPASVVLGVVALGVSIVLWRAGRLRMTRGTVVLTALLGVACWAAPLADVATRSPHNLELLLEVAGAGDGAPVLSLMVLAAAGAVLWWLHRRGGGVASGRPSAVVPWLVIATAVLLLSASRAGGGRAAYIAFALPAMLVLLTWPLVGWWSRSRHARTAAYGFAAAVALSLLLVPRPFDRFLGAAADRAAPVVERAREVAQGIDGPVVVRSTGVSAWVDIAPAVYAALVADGRQVYFEPRVDGRREDDFRHPRHLDAPHRELIVDSHADRPQPAAEGAVVERVVLPERPDTPALGGDRYVDLVLTPVR
ncbi:hypothetical protein [Aeromicrobium duanguangcaii]|uniref:Glycosyltransferase RgtA/B/C/D-like domain-containing protein n=1 Tax=Aeromicrobium duanguangcaii TaxID=2968086 RepID=A0ABY5KI73_9ACTN|nr:hypothetical protein [Aeromicrobium duanguangcaii]MCD9153367.1 hypothetical protein [Aeromicrobium duanguangcaii]UUI69540.1 hypothetical protein NP095_05440 [Aeromicrobium duanguangcaii]